LSPKLTVLSRHTGVLALGLLGLLFKLVLGRHGLELVPAFFGLTFILTFVAFLPFISTVPTVTNQQN
jgi:hypothetical protein